MTVTPDSSFSSPPPQPPLPATATPPLAMPQPAAAASVPAANSPVSPSPVVVAPAQQPTAKLFTPQAPSSVQQTGLTRFHIEELLLKALFNMGPTSSRQLSNQIKLAGPVVREVLESLRADLLVTYKGTADLVDFIFQLTENGANRAEQLSRRNTYYGATPVTIEDYIKSVRAQSLARFPLRFENVQTALSELYMTREKTATIAEAVNSGRGMFLYGAAGNGKTSVAERLMQAYPDTVWIPRALLIGSDVVHLFDSAMHQEVPANTGHDLEQVDRRWVQIKRPTVVAGGELMLEHLEVRQRLGVGVLEAPLQLKANCGSLVIDDFGRNRVAPFDLLNRLILPLDRSVDYITLPNGRQLQVPFELLLVFSTNMDPVELVDEAFLRRIPFKIMMPEPDEAAFREVFNMVGTKMQIECPREMVDYLVQQHFQTASRQFRFCHPRDLLFLVGNMCSLHGTPRRLTKENLDSAVNTYFVGV